MNNNATHGLNICFISNSNNSYLTDNIELSDNDFIQKITFDKVSLLHLKSFNPNIIIVDEYFKSKEYTSIINSIELNFKHCTIYFLSPEYANYKDIIQSVNNKKHFYSSLSNDIIKQINQLTTNKKDNYLEAS